MAGGAATLTPVAGRALSIERVGKLKPGRQCRSRQGQLPQAVRQYRERGAQGRGQEGRRWAWEFPRLGAGTGGPVTLASGLGCHASESGLRRVGWDDQRFKPEKAGTMLCNVPRGDRAVKTFRGLTGSAGGGVSLA